MTDPTIQPKKYRIAFTLDQLHLIRQLARDKKTSEILPLAEDLEVTMLYHQTHEFIVKIVSGLKKADTAYVAPELRQRDVPLNAASLGLLEELHTISDVKKLESMSESEQEEFWKKQESELMK